MELRVKMLAAVLAVVTTTVAAEDKSLNIYNWNDYIAEDTIPAFEKATGIKVNYDLYDSNATLQSKLLTGSSGYDVVYPSVEYAGKQIQAKIFQPLDKSKLPNLTNIDPVILKALEAADPGNQYLVPYMWFTTGVAINVDKVTQALGGTLPDNAWDLLFDPKVTEKLKGCGISMMDEASDLVPAAMLYAGKDTKKMASADINAAIEQIRPVRKNVRTFNSSPIDLMAKGSVCVAMMFSGDAMIAGDRAKESNTGVKVQYIIPKTGAMMSIDVMAVPSDARNVGNAHAWINTMMDPKVIAQISNETFYFSANTAAQPLMSKALTDNPMLNVPAELKALLHPKPVLTQTVQRDLTRALSRFKTAK
ncbi:spermidine/putrescine ABC transporter substrate-binding protein PotF [Parazoarcus communis]|uniref:Putrescine-binding periplasmic protein n=1 Tax=Parazoarcus communis TaxID=41977 RepID=A0A2U8H5E6_9RHOO|nr:polyamine ABC transporter substrate-binding protein [Parazoarcus communis]AWI81162.1 spermidine/putrescine ABC transporter substrate-binding protein PotF [Parazoarcus communis]